MAVTITELPQRIEISGNQIIFKAATDRYPTNVGVRALHTIGITTEPDENSEILLSYYELGELVEVRFTFSDTPSDSGDQIATNTGGLPLAEYIEQVISPGILGHPRIANNYEVFYQGAFIYLYAIESGEAFNLTATNVGFNMNFIQNIVGEDFQSPANYQLMYRVHVRNKYNLGSYSISTWHYATPDLSGEVTVDIGPIINAYILKLDSLMVDPDNTFRNDYTIRDYFVEVSERFEANFSNKFLEPQKKTVRSSLLYAIRGKEPVRLFSGSIFYPSRVGKWLGLQGLERSLTFDSTALFSTVIPDGVVTSDEISHTIKVYLSDGTEQEGVFDTSAGFKTNDLITVKAGFNALGQDQNYDINEVVCYELSLKVNDLEITQVMTIYPEKSKRYHHELTYRGAQGTAETLMINGERSESYTVNKKFLETTRPLPINPDDHTTAATAVSGRDTLTIHSGVLTESMILGVWELLHSDEVYLIENGSPVAVSLQNKNAISQKLTRDGDNLHGVQFKFLYMRE